MRRNVGYLAFASITILGTACSPQQASPPSPPSVKQVAAAPAVQLDLSTPDKALRSYWAVKDDVRRRIHQVHQNKLPALRDAEKPLETVLTAAMLGGERTSLNDPESFARDILEVKVESDSRAVVIAVIKNTTPIPAGASLSSFDEERRRDGERYKYVLERADRGWQLAEIWDWSTYPSASWKKIAPDDGKPIVSSLTFQGF